MAYPTLAQTTGRVPFESNRDLLNPHFEGYQLQLTGREHPEGISLPRPVQPVLLSSQLDVTYGEMRARACYNHLFQGPTRPTEAAAEDINYYIDNAGRLMAVRSTSQSMELQPIFEIPEALDHSTLSGDSIQQYTSIVSYGPWIVLADGKGRVFLLNWAGDAQEDAQVHTKWMHRPPSDSDQANSLPCMVLDAVLVNTERGRTMRLLIMDIERPTRLPNDAQAEHAAPTSSQRSKTQFRVRLVHVHLDSPVDSQIEYVHEVHSRDPPFYAYFEPDTSAAYVLGGRTPFEAPVSDASVILSNLSIESGESPATAPLYAWTQTDDGDLTVYITLPEAVQARQIRCKFSADALSLAINGAIFDCPGIYAVNKCFYDQVLPGDCLWTLESGRLLTLHLQKAGPSRGGPTRWPHVFAVDDGVLETLDPSALADIRDRLNRFTGTEETASSANAMSAVPASSGAGVFGDAREAEDDEGEAAAFARVLCNPTATITQRAATGSQDWLGVAIRERTPSTAEMPSSIPRLPAVCLRHDVDGVVYEMGAGSEQPLHAQHAATFDAFGFVQASKRDRRFIVFSARAQFIAVVETRRRAYIYLRPASRHSMYAPQRVVDLVDDDSDILGVQIVEHTAEEADQQSSAQLLLLTEHRLHSVSIDLTNGAALP